MTIIIPRDQDHFGEVLERLMGCDHPDKRISVVTDTPYTGLDVPMSLAVAAGFLPEQTEENSTPPDPAPLDSTGDTNGTQTTAPRPAPPEPVGDVPATPEDGAPAGASKDQAPADTTAGDPAPVEQADATPEPAPEPAAEPAADKNSGARNGRAGKSKTDAPAQGATERKDS